MFLRKAFNKNTGRTYLSIVHSYRDSQGKTKSKVHDSVGYLDELVKDYDDPIAHFTAVAKQMDDERKAGKNITYTADSDEQIERGVANRRNYGHVVFSKIYHELEIDRFLKNARRHETFEFNTDSIMRLLVFARLLDPASKRASLLRKEHFFNSSKISLTSVYDALTHFDKVGGALQQHLHEEVTAQYGRETDLVYYDVTNYYFEIDKQDELRKRGPEKNRRKDPIVQMGLLMDKLGLPISYRIFAGNTHDSQTLMPMLTEVKQRYGVNRIIAVADKALNSGDNIVYNTVLGDGYIYSKSVRGASEEFKKWILDDSDYRISPSGYKIKSRIVPDHEISFTTGITSSGRKKKTKEKIEQKHVVFYSEKYAARAKHKREETIEKALKMIENPLKYRRTFDYGAVGYIENLKIDKETGELMNLSDNLRLNEEKIAEEEKYDGYYALATSELDDTDEHIREMYRGLWRIEESFKITKSVLQLRPIHLRTKAHINGHFLICFIALLIGRITELRLNGKYTIAKIVETLRKVECSHISENNWLFDFADEVTDDMNVAFGTDFGKKRMTLMEIRKNLGAVKKR